MNKYHIETGGETWEVEAHTPREAVAKAFRDRIPQHPGKVVLVKVGGRNATCFDIVTAMEAAGYREVKNENT